MKKTFLPIPNTSAHAKNQLSRSNSKGARPWTDRQTDKQTNTHTYPEQTKDWRPMKFLFFNFYFFIGGLKVIGLPVFGRFWVCLFVHGLAPLLFDLENWFFAWALVLAIGKNVFFKFLNFYFFTELCPFFRFLMMRPCNLNKRLREAQTR